ncbi:VWA domain-containing protein [Blastopirellula sp. JC732]|uniref:VWA domain-containing protein n=1 Tax=Blastopirellula sediminis TaxID=2894196 RepID=A0A9X1MM06_9BACT|nr:vWA domain-containing protein [Blastopirellula sediminis]MCC9608866.1 VWA domain-containing protein [Blastopirellula sediminis]MCC9628357.1 VWA domain-containing protein [Blastopirellula sediminis]
MNRLLIAAFLVAGGLSQISSTLGADNLNVVVILDNSGSMNEGMHSGGTRIDAAKSALLRVLDQTPAGAKVGVFLLNAGPTGNWLIPLAPVDKSEIKDAVSNLRADGGTPLGASMKSAADALLQLRESQRYGDYKLLIVSDGEASDANLVERFLPEIQARGLLIDVIGVNMAREHSLATRTSTYRNAGDPKSLEQAISAVVLGESSASNANDAGESDFELLASVPSELAAASLAALTGMANDPVGESGRAGADNLPPIYPNSGTQVANQPNFPGNAAPAPPQHGGGDNGGGGLTFGRMVIVIAIIIVVLRAFSFIAKQR